MSALLAQMQKNIDKIHSECDRVCVDIMVVRSLLPVAMMSMQ